MYLDLLKRPTIWKGGSAWFDGFAAENVPGTTGIFFTFFRSRCTRLKTTSFEIASYENLDGSVVPWY